MYFLPQLLIQGFKQYFQTWSNWSVIFEILLSILILACFSLLDRYRLLKMKEFRETRFDKMTMKTFVEFRSLATFEFILTCLCALLALINLIKMFVLSKFIPLSQMFIKMVLNIKSSLVIPGTAIFLFQLLGQMLFCRSMHSFSAFWRAFAFILLIALNPKNFSMRRSNEASHDDNNSVYLVFTCLFMNYVILNFFIALINDAFSRYKQLKKRPSKKKHDAAEFAPAVKSRRQAGNRTIHEYYKDEMYDVSITKKAQEMFYIMKPGDKLLVERMPDDFHKDSLTPRDSGTITDYFNLREY